MSTDTIMVLDRSGSMGEDNKWHYATEAVRSLLDRLGSNDRIAFVTFDNSARVESPLVWANSDNIQHLKNLVGRLAPGDSTNLGDALLVAERLARNASTSERGRRVILLSDGHANAGIVAQEGLDAIARRIADQGSIVSTIGMGLGFNEVLMASLADQGMGHFSYLEHLESLASILSKELQDSRQVYANASEVSIQLPEGIVLVDAAGYPYVTNGSTVVIRTGQLLQNSTKHFMTTLRVNSHIPAEYAFGRIHLDYRVDGQTFQHPVSSEGLIVACVPPERQEEVVASIDKDLYQDAWIKNNLGSMMRKIGDYVRTGEKDKAEELMQSYRGRVEEASAAVPELKEAADRDLADLEARVDEAFEGDDQKRKQNRAAKSFLGYSQQLQRQTNSNSK